jgi:hypothetical protein
MMRRTLRWAWGVLVATLVLVAGCGSPEPVPLIFNQVPWADGEVSTFRVTDLNGAFAGTSRYDLTRRTEGGWSVRRETVTQGDQEIVVVSVGESGLRPTDSTLVRITPAGTEQVQTVYAGSQANLLLTTKQDITTNQAIAVPSDVRDQQMVFMLLRALPLAANYATRINLFLPVVPLMERVTVAVKAQEDVTVPAGSFSTWRVELKIGDNLSRAWIDTQAPYRLVKYLDGRNRGTFELTEYVAGR